MKAILFDLFETLITESATQPAGVSSHAAALGCERDAFRREWKALRPTVLTGRPTFAQALGDVTAAVGGVVDAPAIQRIAASRAEIKAVPYATIEPQIVDMVDQLRGRGLRLAVVSNCFAEDVAAWPQCVLAPRFDAAVFSCEAGVAKPDPAIFIGALRRLNVHPSEAIYIADGADNELAGAEQAGLRAFKALWFLKRWPHFRGAGDAAAVVETPQEVVAMVADDRGSKRSKF
jgi:putative hydrolase of the HAD superfamily